MTPLQPSELEEQINSILNSYSDAITDTNYAPKPNARPNAKARIIALIQQEKNKLLDELIEHRQVVIDNNNAVESDWFEAVPVAIIKGRKG